MRLVLTIVCVSETVLLPANASSWLATAEILETSPETPWPFP